MKTVLVCFGTRPEAIKMAPVIHELQRQGIEYKVCVTAQHREMLDQVLDFFKIVPDYDLNLMSLNQSLNQLSSRIFSSMDEVLIKTRPNLILVHGDTTTSVIAALAAFHRGVKIGHVEAGLRTFNLHSPFPEEMNRQVTGRLTTFHFAPTQKARENLLKENVFDEKIFVTGNTIVDAITEGRRKIQQLDKNSLKRNSGLYDIDLGNFILLTGHRRENIGEGFTKVCEAVLELVKKFPDLHIVFPVHLNPKVQEQVLEKLANVDRVHLIKPVAYPEMLWLMEKCKFIISDSGGIQEEAPTFGKKVLVTRDFSERMEGVEAGFSILVGTDKARIVAEASIILNKPSKIKGENPYGDGKAAQRIVETLQRHSEE